MGAIVAAGVAVALDRRGTRRALPRSFVDSNPLSDYTLPFDLAVRRPARTRLLRTAFGEKDIEDLILPFFCVTANLTTSNADVHTVGRLWRWLRASVSIPACCRRSTTRRRSMSTAA
jgi:NTE family protein